MLPFFYTPETAFLPNDEVVLPVEEAAHAAKVLRLRPGDEIIAVDGKGTAARLCLTRAGRRDVRGSVLSLQKDLGEPKIQLTIGLSLLKQRARFETFLEKAVELGVWEIQPLIAARTETATWRHERAQSIMIGAMKQCRRSRLPQLQRPMSFRDVLSTNSWVAYAQAGVAITELLRPPPKQLQVLVGPEGGFSEAEIAMASESNSTLVRLGPRRLRSETAAIAACAAVMLAVS